MPLKMSLKQTDKVFIVGQDDSGAPGVALLPGQVVTVTPADATVVITPDASPAATDADYNLADGTLVPKGTATQFSGLVAFGANPVVGAAVNVVLSIKNTDGSAVNDDTGAAITDQTDTVTLVAAPLGQLKKEGELFGVPA
jgi:hypothetical protein